MSDVKVILHKAALQFPENPPSAEDFYRKLDAFDGVWRTSFPNVEAVYTTTRTYGGWASRVSRGEPLARNHGPVLDRWHRDRGGERNGVWYGWGPYIWAPDCATGLENGSGICYVRGDYAGDGQHPAASGRAKVAQMIHEFFLTQDWY